MLISHKLQLEIVLEKTQYRSGLVLWNKYSHKQNYKPDLINWKNLQKSNNCQFPSKEDICTKSIRMDDKMYWPKISKQKKKWKVQTVEDQRADYRFTAPTVRHGSQPLSVLNKVTCHVKKQETRTFRDSQLQTS